MRARERERREFPMVEEEEEEKQTHILFEEFINYLALLSYVEEKRVDQEIFSRC